MNDRFFSSAKALVATVRAGSISGAAVELKTTKSSISQKLSLFEAELGLVLLDRSGRSVSPTAAGRRIFDLCVDAVDSAAEAEAKLGLLHTDKISGRVAVSGPNTLLATVFVPMLGGLHVSYPDIDIELYADDERTDFSVEDIDLAFRTGAPGKGKHMTSLLNTAERIICASPQFLEQNDEITCPKDLETTPCILRHQERREWEFKDRKGNRHTIVPRPSLKINTMELAHAAAALGNGVALLPTLIVQRDLDNGKLIRLLPNWEMDKVKLSLLCRAARLSAPEVAAVRQFVLEACRKVS